MTTQAEKSPFNPKIEALREKISLYRELGLSKEVEPLAHELGILLYAHIPYEVVTKEQGQKLLCPKVQMFCGGSDETPWGPNTDGRYRNIYPNTMPWHSCQRGGHEPTWFPHKVTYQHELGIWRLDKYALSNPAHPRPDVPFGCAVKMKEAVGRGLVGFEIWAPLPFGKEKMVDPWLVGYRESIAFKVVDWR